MKRIQDTPQCKYNELVKYKTLPSEPINQVASVLQYIFGANRASVSSMSKDILDTASSEYACVRRASRFLTDEIGESFSKVQNNIPCSQKAIELSPNIIAIAISIGSLNKLFSPHAPPVSKRKINHGLPYDSIFKVVLRIHDIYRYMYISKDILTDGISAGDDVIDYLIRRYPDIIYSYRNKFMYFSDKFYKTEISHMCDLIYNQMSIDSK